MVLPCLIAARLLLFVWTLHCGFLIVEAVKVVLIVVGKDTDFICILTSNPLIYIL